MNANAIILQPFPASADGEFVRLLKQGEVWSGTVRADGVFLFHVPDEKGKLHLQKLKSGFNLVKVTPYS